MKRLLTLLMICISMVATTKAQEYFFIRDFDIDVKVNQDASLDVKETIAVHFNESRHGIFRKIPYRYKLEDLPDSVQKADSFWIYKGYKYTKIKNIHVKNFASEVYSDGDYQTIKIGSKDKYVDGEQVYEISYTILGAVNFFPDYSELYLNLTGNGWPVEIKKSHFTIHFFKPLAKPLKWFVATGSMGSRENITNTRWKDESTLEGVTTQSLSPFQGITAGVRMPAGFLIKPDYKMMGKEWMLLPLVVLLLMFSIWRKWGKDLPITVTTQFYPPENISPSVAGYVIDGKLNRRDLTALIPYWGAGGYLKVEETEKKRILGLLTDHEYKFIKIKDLPATAEAFEQTMFNGLFSGRDEVLLSDLKNSFYTTMNASKRKLENEIIQEHYYVRFTRTFSAVLPVIGAIFFILGIINLFSNYPLDTIFWVCVSVSALIVIILGALMTKKTEKGTELYQKLLGFKEFIKSVEKDRLQEFLKQDPNYFDKVLPFAIVFDVADTWKDKLKGLDVPPPTWYSGSYSGNTFSTMAFMNSLDHGMNSMSQSFYSMPSSSGSSGGSFGGGGFSGGGFGGGGGGSW